MLSGPMVYRARTGNLDVPVLFWTALGVLALAVISVRGLSVRRAALLGACAALATATKDQAYGGWLAAILLALVLHWRRLLPDADLPGAPRWRAPTALILCGLGVYLVAAGVLFWPGRFLAHMRFILSYEEARFAFADLGLRRSHDALGLLLLAGDAIRTSVAAVGPPAAAIACVGMFSPRRSTPFLWLLAAMATGYFALVIVPIAHMQYRYALLPAFLLAFPAARWLATATRAAGARGTLAAAAGAIALAWLVAISADLSCQMLDDARYDAGEWLASNLQPGQRIGFFGDRGQLPAVPEGVDVVRLAGDASGAEVLRGGPVDVLLIIPDYTTPLGGERSLFLPQSTYAALQAGAFPYARAERFEPRTPKASRRGSGERLDTPGS
jgi:hypothetical protein